MPSTPSDNERAVHNNLKHLNLVLYELPEECARYITSCIPAPPMEFLEIYTVSDRRNWVLYSKDTELVDRFSAYLGNIKNLRFLLFRTALEDSPQQLQSMLARTWRFVNKIRGSHRHKNMITSAEIILSPDDHFDHICNFVVRENKHFNFCVPFLSSSAIFLQDMPIEDMEDMTMVQSINIYDIMWSRYTTNLLQFMQYMVKRCSRLNRLCVSSKVNEENYIVLAPAALMIAKDETLPSKRVTTPTEDNILYASYSDIELSNYFLQSIPQIFPNIQTVRLEGCDFEGPDTSINLSCFMHLYRLELDLKQIRPKNSARFVVIMENNASVNYLFKRVMQKIEKQKGAFELVSTDSETQEEENCVVIHILCFKVEEMELC